MSEYNKVNSKDFIVTFKGEVIPAASISATVNRGITKEPILGGEVSSESPVIDKNISLSIPITEEKYVQAMNLYPTAGEAKFEISSTYKKTGSRTTYYGCQTSNYSDNLAAGSSDITVDIIFDTRSFS